MTGESLANYNHLIYQLLHSDWAQYFVLPIPDPTRKITRSPLIIQWYTDKKVICTYRNLSDQKAGFLQQPHCGLEWWCAVQSWYRYPTQTNYQLDGTNEICIRQRLSQNRWAEESPRSHRAIAGWFSWLVASQAGSRSPMLRSCGTARMRTITTTTWTIIDHC